MAASLTPAVSGAKLRPFRRLTILHGAGLIIGASIMGLILTLLGSILIATGFRPLLIAPLAVALALTALQSMGVGIPQSRWQVPEYWRRALDANIVPVLYGVILGFGVFTSVVVGAFWVFVALTLRYAGPVALLGWCCYAAGRIIGFRFALRVQPVERMFLTSMQRKMLVIATTVVAALVVVF